MATPPNLIHLAFAAGLDESQQDEVLDPLRGFSILENGRQDKRGGFSKRLGFQALSLDRFDGTVRTTGNRLLSHGESICTIDGTHLDSYSASQEASATAGRVPEVGLATRTLAATGDGLYDVVHCNGYVACAMLRRTTVVVSVETADGVVVRSPESVFVSSATETAALFGTYSTYILLLALDASTDEIELFYLNTASMATVAAGWQSVGAIVTDKTVTGVAALALSTQSLTDRVAFAYVNNSAGTSRATIATCTIAGISETQAINTASTTPDVVAVEGSIADTLWVAWNQGTTVRMQGRDADALGTTLASTVDVFSGSYASGGLSPPQIVSGSTLGTGRIAINTTSDAAGFGTPSVKALAVATFSTTGSTISVSTPEFLFGASIWARPFRVGDRYYGMFQGGSLSNRTLILGDWTDTTALLTRWIRPVALAFPNLTLPASLGASHPVSFSATEVAYATRVARSAEGTAVELLTYNFADSSRWESATHNRSLYFTGGLLSYFDGRRVAEAGFLYAPAAPIAEDSSGGSGVNGPVKYVATFEEVDTDGNWCISGVSDVTTLASITDNSATVTVEPLAISGRLSATTDHRVRVALYRTLEGGEAPYYFVDDAPVVTGGFVTFTDSTTDEELRTHRLLYGTGNLPGTNGAGQDRRVPPFCCDVVSYAGMLVVASGSDLWWSGQTVGGEGIWFSPAFSLAVDGEGYVTALAAQDGTLYAFKRNSIFAMAGESPSDNGAFGGLGAPRRLAADVGCVDPRSVVVTSAGIFFQSDRGIELLNRGGAVQWIGEPIQDKLASFPVVSSAVLDSRNGLVRFSLSESESEGRVSGDGRTVVFDLTLGAWISVDRTVDTAQDGAVVYLDGVWRYAYLTPDGTVRVERLASDDQAHLDDTGLWITMAAETAWFKTGGLQGRQVLSHVLLLARRHTDHNLKLSLAYNYEEEFRAAREWSYETINSLLDAGWPVTQLKHEPHNDAPCQAVRIRIEDEQASPSEEDPVGGDTASGKGATWIGLTLDITPKPGVFDVPEEAA